MSKGQECPHCGKLTYHDRHSHRLCTSCGYIGWEWARPVTGMGPGPGNTCPWCGQMTLHDIVALPDGHVVRRCATCNYTAIEPPET